jgi:hypothetical protein
MVDRKLLRLSATLLLVGAVFETIVSEFLHPGGGPTDEATFAIIAASRNWTAVHVGQFVGLAIIFAGLIVLVLALNLNDRSSRAVGLLGIVSAGVTWALAGFQYAVDGVANQQAMAAWVSAPAAEKAARFASAQAIRWLEWGAASYENLMFGVTLVLLGIVIAWTARVPRPIGYLMGLSGLAFIVLGWRIGTQGFTSGNTLPTQVGYTLIFVFTIWLLIVAWRRAVAVQPASV